MRDCQEGPPGKRPLPVIEARSLQAFEGQPWRVLRAKAVADCLAARRFAVNEHELIVGRPSADLESPHAEEDAARQYLQEHHPWPGGQTSHCELDLGPILCKGIDGVAADIRARREQAEGERREAYESSLIVLDDLATLLHTVSVYHADKEIARHRRCWQRERQIFDPVHYLALLERKPGSLDHARPLAGWNLPGEFAVLRRRLEAWREDGTREYIRVLLLLREYPLARVAGAVAQALRWSAPTADAIKQLLIPAERPELKTFCLAGRQHLAGVTVARTDLAAYGRLQEVVHG